MTSPRAHPQRVFLAEDDDDQRELIRIALERDGCEVFAACDGAQLLAHFDRIATFQWAHSDVVITDVSMPTISGLRVLRTLRQAHAIVPVILIMADSSNAALGGGAAAVFTKPFELEDLRTAVANAYQLRTWHMPRAVGT